MGFYRIGRADVPYSQQPPDWMEPANTGINRGLMFASPAPHAGAFNTQLGSWVAPKIAHGTNAPTYSKTPFIGKSLVVNSTSVTPMQYDGMTMFQLPMTVMVNFRQNSQPTQGTLLACGGSGGPGWEFAADSAFVFVMSETAGYYFTMPQAIDVSVDYTAVLVATGDNGTATVYFKRQDRAANAIYQTNTLAIGALTTNIPARPLSVGAAFNDGSTSWVDPGDSHIGSFAVWNRALSASEANALLLNPFQVWKVPSYGKSASFGVNTTITGVAATGAVGSTTQSGKASTTVTGTSATSHIGIVAIGSGSTVPVTGVEGTGILLSPSYHVRAYGALTGVEATTAIGTASGAPAPTTVYLSGFSATATLGEFTASAWRQVGVPGSAVWTEISGV